MPRFRRKKKKIQPASPVTAPAVPTSPLPAKIKGDWRSRQPRPSLPQESDLIERLGIKVIQ